MSEFLGDFIVYRNLAPVDRRLPRLKAIATEVGLPESQVPRKSELAYGRVIACLLRHARALQAPGQHIQRLLYLGDTRLLDGAAFENICRSSGWPGLAFIGSEDPAPARVEVEALAGGLALYKANRWAALVDFERYCAAQGFAVDPTTAVVIDLDKTAVGARGRNAGVIDSARVQAVYDTVAGLLGAAFDPAAFQAAYDLFNQVEFHPFTGDNQDYLAYLCLALGSGLAALEPLAEEVRAGKMTAFDQFIARTDERVAGAPAGSLPAALAEMHRSIYSAIRAGDPTPFKSFRHNEYLTTVRRFGCRPDATPVEQLLLEEITITQEVRACALAWRSLGALIFGLSDKPDEASLPTAAQAAQGYPPLHRAETHCVGQSG